MKELDSIARFVLPRRLPSLRAFLMLMRKGKGIWFPIGKAG